MDMNEDFEASPLGPNPTTTLELKVLYNIIAFPKNSDQCLFFESSKISVGHLEVGFLVL